VAVATTTLLQSVRVVRLVISEHVRPLPNALAMMPYSSLIPYVRRVQAEEILPLHPRRLPALFANFGG